MKTRRLASGAVALDRPRLRGTLYADNFERLILRRRVPAGRRIVRGIVRSVQ